MKQAFISFNSGLRLFKDIRIMVLSASSKGTYYFDEATEIGTIRYSRLIDGKHEEPQRMSKEINTGKWIATPLLLRKNPI